MSSRPDREIRGQASRQLHLLLGVCVGGMLASVLAVAWSSHAAAERRAEIAVLRDRTRVTSENWSTVEADVERRMGDIFDESNGSIAGSVPHRALESLRAAILELLEGVEPSAREPVLATLVDMDRVVRASVTWRLGAEAAALEAKDGERRLAQSLDTLRADVARALDELRLRESRALEASRGSSRPDLHALPDLLAASGRMIEIERECREMAGALRSAARIAHEADLASLCQDHFDVLLPRLDRLVAECASEPETAELAAHAPIEVLRTDLYGAGHRPGDEGVPPDRGSCGYLAALSKVLDERRAGVALRVELERLHQSLVAGVESVRTRTLERLAAKTLEAESALGNLELWLFAILGLALCGTMVVASRTSKSVRGLVDRLHDSHLEQQVMIDQLATLRAAVESADTGMIVCDPNGIATWSNPAITRLTGRASEELVGRGTEDILVPIQDESAMSCAIPGTGRTDVRVVRGDGSERTAEQSVTAVLDSNGVPIHRVVFLTDVTDNRGQGERLRRALIENGMILDSITSILIVVDGDLCVRTWNHHAEKVMGLQPAEVAGRRIDEIGLEFMSTALRDPIEQSLRDRVSRRVDDLTFQRAETDLRYLAFTIAPIVSREGVLHGCLLVGRDLTQMRMMQDQLTQAQKLESIGQLAAGIAHEINTPTQFVSDNTRFVQTSFRELEDLLVACRAIGAQSADAADAGSVEALRAIVRKTDLDFLVAEIPKALEDNLAGLGRVAKIVGAMKQFSHMGTGTKEFVDMNSAIQNTCTVARNEWKYVADIEFDLQKDLPEVPCLPAEMAQVFLNIVVNAAHAMQGPGDKPPVAKGRIVISTRAAAGWVEIRISDTGSGIPESIRRRIYDPFFTTKGVGKGTGQGLAIARSIVVDRHGGTIGCESEVGRGTTFVVRLPLVDVEKPALQAVTP